MKKNPIFFVVMLAVALVFSVALVACDVSGDDNSGGGGGAPTIDTYLQKIKGDFTEYGDGTGARLKVDGKNITVTDDGDTFQGTIANEATSVEETFLGTYYELEADIMEGETKVGTFSATSSQKDLSRGTIEVRVGTSIGDGADWGNPQNGFYLARTYFSWGR